MKLKFLLRCLPIEGQGYYYEANLTPIILKIPTKSKRHRIDTLYFTQYKVPEFTDLNNKMWSIYKLKKLQGKK